MFAPNAIFAIRHLEFGTDILSRLIDRRLRYAVAERRPAALRIAPPPRRL